MNVKTQLDALRDFVQTEQEANLNQLLNIWEKPLAGKLASGETQTFSHLELISKDTLIATLTAEESRFREGDMLCLHTGDPCENTFVRQVTIDEEDNRKWILSGKDLQQQIQSYRGGVCYADADSMDLTPFFDKALTEIAASSIGKEIILPLLAGQLDVGFCYMDNYDSAADLAESMGFNEGQQEAVGYGVAARYVACIQGPPGTGKTKVIGLIAKILVDEGQNVLLTSHTHMAINNALNKIHHENVPVVKVGATTSRKALNPNIKLFAQGNDWHDRPEQGYVIGATPFATCTKRLENFEFDTVIFDEASQITVPLAVMAMRKARRFVFVGDHQQLPPVVLSKSILDKESYSVFAQLIEKNNKTSVMLGETYRMNQWLTTWPSDNSYHSKLSSVGSNQQRTFDLPIKPTSFKTILSNEHSLVYIPSPGVACKTLNIAEAELISNIVKIVLECKMESSDIGIVTPFRNQARRLKTLLAKKLSKHNMQQIVIDTVERMQGQERELIILSLCATDLLFIRNIAPFFFQPQRLNVAITRPMTKLIIIGPDIENDFIDDDEQIMCWIKRYLSLINQAYRPNIGDL